MSIKYFHFEGTFNKKGYNNIAGVDEAGRGPLAGPVVAAAVILNYKDKIKNLNDSKLLNNKQRENLYNEIIEKAISVSFSVIDEKIIDEQNILKATFIAMKEAIINIKSNIDIILVDGNKKIPGLKIPQQAVVKGDRICSSIAAASIIAKVERDKIMRELDQKYPQYGFTDNKGYGTQGHLEALYKYGLSPCHRKTFNTSNQLKLF